MGNDSTVVASAIKNDEPHSGLIAFKRPGWAALLEAGVGYTLIMATIWSSSPLKHRLFWAAAGWFLLWGVVEVWRRRWRGFTLPSFRFIGFMVGASILLAAGVVGVAAVVGTLHGLFGLRNPLLHAGGYIFWAVVQQYIQQGFFFSRFEQITGNGLVAGFIAAFLFGMAHLPNPVLAPVTFVGGWLLSEIFRRYRCVIPLGIGHGLVGIAIALSVPDHLQHHMRVGLSYLHYLR